MPDEFAVAEEAARAEEVMPDIGPGMEWYRELRDE
jgi:hypothetical protein